MVTAVLSNWLQSQADDRVTSSVGTAKIRSTGEQSCTMWATPPISLVQYHSNSHAQPAPVNISREFLSHTYVVQEQDLTLAFNGCATSFLKG